MSGPSAVALCNRAFAFLEGHRSPLPSTEQRERRSRLHVDGSIPRRSTRRPALSSPGSHRRAGGSIHTLWSGAIALRPPCLGDHGQPCPRARAAEGATDRRQLFLRACCLTTRIDDNYFSARAGVLIVADQGTQPLPEDPEGLHSAGSQPPARTRRPAVLASRDLRPLGSRRATG
jgi:hypothetical protein